MGRKKLTRKMVLKTQLGIPSDRKIPNNLLKVIARAKSGQTIINPTSLGKRRIKVTPLIKRRSILTKNLR